MNAKDIRMIVSVALGTATLTVVTFLSGSTIADGDGTGAKIAQPKLLADGVEMTLTAADGQAFKAGDEPTFALNAVNTTGEPAEVNVSVSMTGMSTRDMLSRVPMIPAKIWQQNQIVTLGPKESKVISLSSKTKLPANQVVSVWLAPMNPNSKEAAQSTSTPAIKRLQPVQPGIVALNISTLTAAPKDGVNVAQNNSLTKALMPAELQSLPSPTRQN